MGTTRAAISSGRSLRDTGEPCRVRLTGRLARTGARQIGKFDGFDRHGDQIIVLDSSAVLDSMKRVVNVAR